MNIGDLVIFRADGSGNPLPTKGNVRIALGALGLTPYLSPSGQLLLEMPPQGDGIRYTQNIDSDPDFIAVTQFGIEERFNLFIGDIFRFRWMLRAIAFDMQRERLLNGSL
jgi:hypothetical protein